jgi:hypothetical protein
MKFERLKPTQYDTPEMRQGSSMVPVASIWQPGAVSVIENAAPLRVPKATVPE